MKIRKEFRVESAHIVRNCTSERCSHSIHGHSAVIEVFLESKFLDNAQMVYDFGLMKDSIKKFIDSMDHCYLLCKYDHDNFKNFIWTSCDRYIELPFNPSAEMLSLFVMWGVNRILANTLPVNGEAIDVHCSGVRYHETTTGYAECNEEDFQNIFVAGNYHYIEEYDFSEGVIKDMTQDVLNLLSNRHTCVNPRVTPQIDLHLLNKPIAVATGVGSESKQEEIEENDSKSAADALLGLGSIFDTFIKEGNKLIEKLKEQE